MIFTAAVFYLLCKYVNPRVTDYFVYLHNRKTTASFNNAVVFLFNPFFIKSRNIITCTDIEL